MTSDNTSEYTRYADIKKLRTIAQGKRKVANTTGPHKCILMRGNRIEQTFLENADKKLCYLERGKRLKSGLYKTGKIVVIPM